MTLRAYAKINIGLHVIGKRPDNYHAIETIFHQVDLFDEIDLVHHDEAIHFSTNRSDLPSDRSNLCVQAAQLIQNVTGIPTGVKITLRKKIPVGAGLGGGSADAAAVLKGLVHLLSVEITTNELETMAASLGSDVPFFIRGGTAYATGRGEILEPVPASLPYTIAVVTPPIRVSTGWAYAHIHPTGGRKGQSLKDLIVGPRLSSEELQARFRNDFEETVFAAHPQIQSIKETLLQRGACLALMSGSGSSVFGFFEEMHPLDSLQREFPPSYHCSITKPFFKPIQD
ncbi:MAG: 4-(cytidine 5'-diphospho)-2-C-methyl-D-erythritol kinase [Ignavibacteria bacterium GWA2_55_25]|nr:MAG: 4-(cytidine 5'-diphospho)-2-C-methyl-D-erythritol kinase [Ignavibacteria bacterium GWA2_55_25]